MLLVVATACATLGAESVTCPKQGAVPRAFCCKPEGTGTDSSFYSDSEVVGCINYNDRETACSGWPVAYSNGSGDNKDCTCGPLESDGLNDYKWSSCIDATSSLCTKVDVGKGDSETAAECNDDFAEKVGGAVVGVAIVVWLLPLILVGLCCCGGCFYMKKVNDRKHQQQGTYVPQQQPKPQHMMQPGVV